MSVLKTGLELLYNEGIVEFIRQTRSYLREKIENVYWHVKKIQKVSIGGYSTEFIIPQGEVARQNRYRINSERNIISDLLSELSEDDVFFDVGANSGLYSLISADKIKSGKVVSFEPYPPNYELLTKNISKNNIHCIDPLKIALSNTNEDIEFSIPNTKKLGYGSGAITTGDQKSTVTVPSRTCDELVKNGNFPLPNIVKIDVEGAEPIVLEGMRDSLTSSRCRLLYCEVHLEKTERRPSIHEFGSSKEELTNQIKNMGFKIDILQQRKGEIFLKCKKFQ